MASQNRKITEIQVEDIQKRRHPSKHYVYVIKVIWSDGSRHVIYRRYSRFFDFQLSLLEKFPIEAGTIDPQRRIIPFLPGKIFFGRSHIREVALKRQVQISEYCSALIRLPPHIAEDEELIDFFDLETDDLNPNELEQKQKQKAETISGPTLAEQYIVIADYKKADKWDLNLKAGMVLEVIEKSDSGWWFVNVDDKQGWVPSSYVERKDGLRENTAIRTNLGEDERYISTENYTPQNCDEITLEKGAVVEVLEKNLDGWWFVRSNGNEGIAPSTYLMKTEKAHIERVARASGVQIIGSMSDVSDLLQHSTNSEPVADKRGSVQHILKKQRSLERGGSLRPPPRLNSVNKASDEVMRSLKKTEDHYVTISEFEDNVGDGISFFSGEIVQVLEKSDSGWWFVKIDGQEGWAPASYIGKTHMNGIEEEENVYHDIGEVNEDADNSYNEDDTDDDSDDYEIPDPVKDDIKHEESVNNKLNDINTALQMRIKPSDLSNTRQGISDKGAVKRPNSKPPPPPMGLKPIDIDMDNELSSRNNFKSLTSNGPPVTPPKKGKDKPNLPPKKDTSGSANFQSVLKAKNSSDKPPPPPPKNSKPASLGTGFKNNSSEVSEQKKTPLAELKGKLSKQSDEKKGDNLLTPGQQRYKYTDIVPKDQRQSASKQESLVGVLKSKFGKRQDSSDDSISPITSPKSDTGTKGFVLPTKTFHKQATPPKNVSPMSPKRLNHTHGKDLTRQHEEETSVNKSMGELKARFEKQHPEVSKKPPLKPKTVMNVYKSNSSISSESSSSTVDDKPSVKTSALKAMFEHSNSEPITKQKVVAKTSSGSSKASGIAAMLSSKFESDKPLLKPPVHSKFESNKPLLKPPVQRSNNSSSNQLPLWSKSKVGQSKPPPAIPHKPLKPKTSNPPPLPAKSSSSNTEKVRPKLAIPQKPSNVDKNHNEMGDKQRGITELSKILANKNQSTTSQEESEPPTPPQKDYEILSKCTSPQYKTLCDYIGENEIEVGFTSGENVEVLEQTDEWWFIKVHGEEGWAPASYIEHCEVTTFDDVFHQQYRAVVEFFTEAEGEIDLNYGDILEVLEETDTGWWLVRNGKMEGWAPEEYMEKV
ncbi:SH3PXD2 [Mytilus coruscus]|uniref:SH3PXD2 n=1 Tax=Mytilus coruscus TaxID=42192 RepID=A0A6J8B012_MYTCO|nr:SH3PXD2 [Mytilus coruscus]